MFDELKYRETEEHQCSFRCRNSIDQLVSEEKKLHELPILSSTGTITEGKIKNLHELQYPPGIKIFHTLWNQNFRYSLVSKTSDALWYRYRTISDVATARIFPKGRSSTFFILILFSFN